MKNLLNGKPSEGKSEIIRQQAEENGIEIINLPAITMDEIMVYELLHKVIVEKRDRTRKSQGNIEGSLEEVAKRRKTYRSRSSWMARGRKAEKSKTERETK